ncbi:MAG: DUF459 domain-containing protein [Pseudolabrys sp.]|nr:DUF459 domain-containing protein [Pseudolabrys sp.]
MTRKTRFLQSLAMIAVLGIAECASLAAVHAQDFPFLSRQRAPRNDGGFFGGLFGGQPNRRQDDRDYYQQQQYQTQRAPEDNSKAPPPPRKSSDQFVTTSVVVLGDGMADWLASGLEDAFGDAPEIGIVRKNKVHSGLIRYDARNDLDWWHVARDLLSNEKPNYVVMMLGVSDRQNLRQSDVAKDAAKEADKKADAAASKDPAAAAATPAPAPDQTANKEPEDSEQSIAAPEPPAGRRGSSGSLEFRGDQWEKIYTRRIDDTIAAMKSKGVPVFWVGLPSIRGTRSTADAVYLNDFYRARAEKAGIVYIDVWDGFVDEGGKYNNMGPDYEGQMRRLRSNDGVYFTKFGARKLAHYVEREIRRYMSNRGPIALPSGPMGPVPADGKPTARPLAGPVVPLTMTSSGSDELLGGNVASARADAQAVGVLVKGDAVAAPSGRADDFWWPRGSPPPVIAPPVAATPPAAPPAAATAAVAPAVVAPPPPVPVTAPVAISPEPVARPASAQPARPPAVAARPAPAFRPPPPRQDVRREPPRPPQQVQQQRRNDGGPFGFFR